MSPALATLLLVDLAFIGALPRIFFRRGTLNLSWWMTATPFFAAAAIVLATIAGGWAPSLPESETLATALDVFATLLGAASIVLIAWTCGTHHRPLSLWHQDDDAPATIVTRGPYARIRHPFYTAFLLALGAVALAVPHVSTLALVAYGFLALHRTAVREERRLCGSVFGEEYRAYLGRTGRFHPRLRGLVR